MNKRLNAIERTRAIQRAREQRSAQKYLRAFDAAEGGDLFQVREPMAPRTKAKDPTTDADAKVAAETPVKEGRKHKATYASDKRKGGYLIRVTGPYPEKFGGREIPVTTRAGVEHMEKLLGLVWTGPDSQTGEPVALYKFEAKPRDESEQIAF